MIAKMKTFTGPLLIALASFLWATDTLVRYPASGKMDPTVLVFVEHILVVVLILPYIFVKFKKEALALDSKEWFSAAFSGIGGSGLATLFFTASFNYVNPSVSVLIQKFQPVLVVLIAYLFLGERPQRKFYFWSLIALGAVVVLSFPDMDFSFLRKAELRTQGIQYSFLAALFWAIATVSGKILLKKTPATVATFWRFVFGTATMGAIMAFTGIKPDWSLVTQGSSPYALIYLGIVPGLLAFLAYYMGLARTSASVCTFVELLFPIGAVILNTLFLHTPLELIQTLSGLVLIFAVTMISI